MTEYSNADFEDAFGKMSRAAGVGELSEIIERFRTQNLTCTSLTNQQSNSETDVKVKLSTNKNHDLNLLTNRR